MSSANAVFTGTVTITCAKPSGEQRTFNVGWDNSNSYFDGKGDIAKLYCEGGHSGGGYTVFVSTSVSNVALRYYGGIVPSDAPLVVSESQTATTESSSASVDSPTATQSDTVTVTQETSTPVQETQTVVDSSTSTIDTASATVDTSTTVQETATVIVDTSTTQSQETLNQPLPTPEPIVESQPIVVPEPQPVVQPEPVPVVPVVPTPVEPAPVVDSSTAEVDQVPEEVPVEVGQTEPTAEEQLPVEELPVSPDEEEPLPLPDEPSPVEEPVLIPEPEPLPVVIPEPTSQPDNAYEPPVVVLDNGVILTQEVAEQVELLQNPSELLSELFTNPAAVFAALGAVGADMSPVAREKAKKAVVQAVVVGSIVTQAAGAAAYRRKP